MIDGRGKMLDSVNSELTFLESMRVSSLETIVVQEKLIEDNEVKLHEAHELMDRFEQRTEMCFKLKESLEDFQAALDALAGVDVPADSKNTGPRVLKALPTPRDNAKDDCQLRRLR